MSWLPTSSDIPLEGWWILTVLAILTHLVCFPRWGTTSRTIEKVIAYAYPVLAFIGSVFIGVSADASEELFWAGYVWVMLSPTLVVAGSSKEMDKAEQAQKKHGGNLQDYVPKNVKKRMQAQTVGVLLLGIWLIVTSREGVG
ncbi:hypothetical protein [Streptomyces sp. MAR4 CNX-425]|uniref:hypothetical protein n=1 Tax=Streptomyces sp. MAR4 CNX-425 TaxID=3406343 RepID=UPI003B502BF5